MDTSREQRLYDALKRITCYHSPDKLRKRAAKDYGLDPDEVIEMAYENVLEEARQAIKGIRKPKAEKPAPMTPANAAAYHGDIDGDFDY